jgi:hypothetical protein
LIVIETNILPKRFDALAIWPAIFVRPEFRWDMPLMLHEARHLSDQARFLIIPWFVFYAFSWRFRLWAELRGHTEQVKAGGLTVAQAANHIAAKYNIPIEETEIRRRLQIRVTFTRP